MQYPPRQDLLGELIPRGRMTHQPEPRTLSGFRPVSGANPEEPLWQRPERRFRPCGRIFHEKCASCLGSSLLGRMLSRLTPTDVGTLCAFLTGREKCGLDLRTDSLAVSFSLPRHGRRSEPRFYFFAIIVVPWRLSWATVLLSP
jgi:hypothetical protein